MPVIADVFLQLGDKKSNFKALEFLSWLKTYRTSYARLEYDSDKLDKGLQEEYRKTGKSSIPVQDLQQQLIELVIKEVHQE